MTKAARLGAGTFTFIGRVSEVGERMGGLLAKLEAPVMRDVQVRWPQGVRAEVWPARMPDLYAGEPLVVTAALDRLDGALAVSGNRAAERWHTVVPIVQGTRAPGVGALWAREKVASLMDVLRRGEAETNARAEIVALALSHRLVTKYTSFVAVDASPARPQGSDLLSAPVPTLLPAGWDYGKVFGELPQGATDGRWSLLLGICCLVLAALATLWARRRPV
jgi:Ca-activated chloride channel family protein